jgi:hypothetical protein
MKFKVLGQDLVNLSMVRRIGPLGNSGWPEDVNAVVSVLVTYINGETDIVSTTQAELRSVIEEHLT